MGLWSWGGLLENVLAQDAEEASEAAAESPVAESEPDPEATDESETMPEPESDPYSEEDPYSDEDPYPDDDPDEFEEPSRYMTPVNVPTDLMERIVPSRDGRSDRFARIFSAELRDVEERQSEILAELETLPQLVRGFIPTRFLGYHDDTSKRQRKWVQVDLGQRVAPEAIALFPVTQEIEGEIVEGYGFPRRFQIDISDDPAFPPGAYETVIDSRSRSEFSPREAPFYQEIGGTAGRYIRVSVITRWRPPGEEGVANQAFALSELMVLKGERNLALGRPVTAADSAEKSQKWWPRFLTDGKTTLGVPRESTESPTLGYRTESEEQKGKPWVQIDLAESLPIEEIRVIPALPPEVVTDPSIQFPNAIKLEISDSPDMKDAELVGTYAGGQVENIEIPVIVPVRDGYGRYVRLTAERFASGANGFAVSEIQVFSENQNAALNQTVIAPASIEEEGWSRDYLVDGYSSRHRLTSYSNWLDALKTRGELISEFRELESSRSQLVEQTIDRAVQWGGLSGGGVFMLVIFGFARSRVRRRKDLEGLRQQIASDLHDDIGSNLSSIALLAELGHSESDEPELVREELTEIKKTADRTVESMRDIVWLIRPGEETWKQLVARFRETAAKLLKTHEYHFENKGSMHDERLPLDFKRDLFLMYKEVLNNIVRHAEAGEVDIHLETRRGRLMLRITDDGKGFDSLDENFREGNGLKNLRQRAQSLGANLKMKSVPGEGTTFQLTMPVP